MRGGKWRRIVGNLVIQKITDHDSLGRIEALKRIENILQLAHI
jgi:hypothetical protein